MVRTCTKDGNSLEGGSTDYETVALPAELRRREAGKTLHPAALDTSAATKTRLQRKHKCFADFPQRNAFGSFTKRGFEAFDRFSERLKAEAERLVVHRHNEASACAIRHLDCLLGCAV